MSRALPPLAGLHHLTAIAGDPGPNLDFYQHQAGMRLVKRTVNYDDPASHHFYFGDPLGMPGSLLTFFPWGHARQPRKGTGQAIAAAFAGAPESIAATEERFGEPVETRLDPERLSLERIAVAGSEARTLDRLHSVTLSVARPDEAEKLLGELLELDRMGQEGNRVRYRIGPDQFIDFVHDPSAEPGKLGAGSIHHVALNCVSDENQLAWRERLISAGLRVSAVRDRHYFHSIYFRCAGNALFEIATDHPGFTVDEPLERLGERLCLPPWLEPHRAEITERLSSWTA